MQLVHCIVCATCALNTVQRRGQRVRGAEADYGGDAPKMEDHVQDRSISEERGVYTHSNPSW